MKCFYFNLNICRCWRIFTTVPNYVL